MHSPNNDKGVATNVKKTECGNVGGKFRASENNTEKFKEVKKPTFLKSDND